jgi:hypothetical protein
MLKGLNLVPFMGVLTYTSLILGVLTYNRPI